MTSPDKRSRPVDEQDEVGTPSPAKKLRQAPSATREPVPIVVILDDEDKGGDGNGDEDDDGFENVEDGDRCGDGDESIQDEGLGQRDEDNVEEDEEQDEDYEPVLDRRASRVSKIPRAEDAVETVDEEALPARSPTFGAIQPQPASAQQAMNNTNDDSHDDDDEDELQIGAGLEVA